MALLVSGLSTMKAYRAAGILFYLCVVSCNDDTTKIPPASEPTYPVSHTVQVSRTGGNSVSQESKRPPREKAQDDKNEPLFQDEFEYVVRRDDRNASDIFSKQGGWRWAKTQQSSGKGNGFLYTVDKIPGYAGPFPGRNSKRALAIEARPRTLGDQTDFYLQYGDTNLPSEAIPANVWYQFWIYPNHYDDLNDNQDQLSRFATRNKFIYPCNGEYACKTGKWILYLSSNSKSPLHQEADVGALFPYLGSSRVGTISNESEPQDWARDQLGQKDISLSIAANRWTLVKIHIDTSTERGAFELWLMPQGGSWKKVAEWIDGVTPDFQWRIPSDQIGGHKVFRMPTTIPGGVRDPRHDFWVYMDDFAMATSEDALPLY